MKSHRDIKTREDWNKHFIESLDRDKNCEECELGLLPRFNGDKIYDWYYI